MSIGSSFSQFEPPHVVERRPPSYGSGARLPIVDVNPRTRGSAVVSYPFAVSIGEDGALNISGGYYQVGATGAWLSVAPLTDTGTKAYFVVTQNSDREVTEVELQVSSEALEAVEAPTDLTSTDPVISRVLLAEVVGTGENARLIQRRYGNFTLGIWQIDGVVVRWPETVGGATL